MTTVLTDSTEVTAPNDESVAVEPANDSPPVPIRRRLLPALVIVCALGLAGGLLLRRVVPPSVPPPVVPVYTPAQAMQAQSHLEALRDRLIRPLPPEDVSPAAPQIRPPSQVRPVRPRVMRLELSQQDLNAFLTTNPGARSFLVRQGVRAIQITFQPPCNLRIRAAIVYRNRPANVQITGRVQPSRRTILGFVATGVQAGRVPLPPEAVSAQADKLAAQLTRRLRGRLPLSVRSVQVVGDRLILTGEAKPSPPAGFPQLASPARR